MIVTVGKNGAIPLLDNEESKLNIGDILLFKLSEDKRSIELEKFPDQTLNDEKIKAHGSLIRVEPFNPDDFK
ncbi:hypothetical protein IT970_00785 [Pseudoalteromonas sp. A41-2]|uniref:hypothetical protein n=1 Tax=unclassified Pseudoalteromonas TaxID=194690 RepID=UPI0018CBD37B|nr:MULTISPECIES: hypothetical protein [unclassified Pseudoalteromonas]MCC9660708.1 hypothetical protein [Pseudoalteromonas sp. MB41]QPL43050.1 hypothetical protein IT970_00785 [Pseudoalteromonas sp. A41-2]